MKKAVIIMGGGIAGLTVAHELSKTNEYDISIFERNSVIGGMARSGYNERGFPTEYCWRIYGPNYHNLFAILKEIPIEENNKTVFDNLVEINDYIIPDGNNIYFMNNNPETLLSLNNQVLKDAPISEKIKVINRILCGFSMCTDRLYGYYDNVTWKDYIGKLSPNMKKYVMEMTAPYLGVDYEKVNVSSIIKTLESFSPFNEPIRVMNSPTNEAWLDHWEKLLKEKGVKIYLNSNIDKIYTREGIIDGLQVNDKEIKADIYVCSLPVESIGRLIDENSFLRDTSLKNISELSKLGKQLMVGMQLYFDKKIIIPKNNKTAIYIPDSEWQLVIEPQGDIWRAPRHTPWHAQTFIGDIWSIGLCDTVKKGKYIDKTFINCNPDEIKTEVWHQIMSCKPLVKYLKLDQVNIIDYNLWNSYVYDGEKLVTYEPKFSPNKGTWRLRPDNDTSISNFFFATAYTKTFTDMFEMESAVESGKRASALIMKKNNNANIGKRPLIFLPLRFMDNILYNIGLEFPPDSGIPIFIIYIFIIIWVIRLCYLMLREKLK